VEARRPGGGGTAAVGGSCGRRKPPPGPRRSGAGDEGRRRMLGVASTALQRRALIPSVHRLLWRAAAAAALGGRRHSIHDRPPDTTVNLGNVQDPGGAGHCMLAWDSGWCEEGRWWEGCLRPYEAMSEEHQEVEANLPHAVAQAHPVNARARHGSRRDPPLPSPNIYRQPASGCSGRADGGRKGGFRFGEGER
jgi:hypothetical protein